VKNIGIDIQILENNRWDISQVGEWKVWFRGYLFNREQVFSLIENSKMSKERFSHLMNQADGHFSLIIENDQNILAGVGKCRTIPLQLVNTDKELIVGDQGEVLARKYQLDEINEGAMLSLSMSGYTMGHDTVYEGLEILAPGEMVFIDKTLETREFHQYYNYSPWKVVQRSRDQLLDELRDLTLGILEKMVKSLGGRKVVIPLSAGMDSRVVASGLKHLGYENVECFSYGTKGNFESKASQEISEKLGQPWKFVPLSNGELKKEYQSQKHNEYYLFSDTAGSFPLEHEYSAMRQITDEGLYSKDDIIVNGMSGDYLTGAHIRPAFYKDVKELNFDQRKQRIVDAAINKHYSLWDDLKSPENLKKMGDQIWDEIERTQTLFDDQSLDYAFYEFHEWKNRQTRYVLTVQKVYDFFGYDWRLPLWDTEYLDFWETVPLEHKINRNLFAEMLERENWGGVWKDFKVEQYLTPRYMTPLRWAIKPFFLPLGKKAWHEFDRRVFAYWYEILCKNACVPYSKVLTDKRGYRNACSWLTEIYLNKKGRDYRGKPL